MTPDPERLSDEPVPRARRSPAEPSVQDGRDPFGEQEEVLDADPVSVWRPSRWLVMGVVGFVLVAITGWHVDRQDRTREMRALEGCRRQLQDAVVFADSRLTAMADYLAPALSATSGTRRAKLTNDMSAAARSVLSDVRQADRGCRAVTIRPWHFALASEHRSATAYSGALAVQLRIVANRGSAYYGDSTFLRRLREAADIHIEVGPF